MRRSLPMVLFACGVFVAALVGLQIVMGGPPDITPAANTDPALYSLSSMRKCRQVSRLIGMEVRNEGQEKLGKIEDLAIDLSTGQIRYAVISCDGVTGIGGKLLPMPWIALTLPQQALKPIATLAEGIGQTYCVLNVNKDALQKAPSFERDQWPDFNNQRLVVAINDFYRPCIIARQRGATTH